MPVRCAWVYVCRQSVVNGHASKPVRYPYYLTCSWWYLRVWCTVIHVRCHEILTLYPSFCLLPLYRFLFTVRLLQTPDASWLSESSQTQAGLEESRGKRKFVLSSVLQSKAVDLYKVRVQQEAETAGVRMLVVMAVVAVCWWETLPVILIILYLQIDGMYLSGTCFRDIFLCCGAPTDTAHFLCIF